MLSHVKRPASFLVSPNLGDRHLGLRPYNPDVVEAYGEPGLAKLAWGMRGPT